MSRQRSSEEVQNERLRVLGPELGSLYHSLCQEVVRAHAKWLEYKSLYGHSPERIALLNRTAGYFFRVIQDVLWDDVHLCLARLVDSPRSAGEENLTVLRLPSAIQDEALRAQVHEAVEAAVERCQFARKRRHKRLAHTDLLLALDAKGAVPLPTVSRRDVDEALTSIAAVMNLLQKHYFDGTVAFNQVLTMQNAESLLYYLQQATNLEEQQRAQPPV